jgi:hypothetical protein
MHRGSVEVNTKTKGSISIAAVLVSLLAGRHMTVTRSQSRTDGPRWLSSDCGSLSVQE